MIESKFYYYAFDTDANGDPTEYYVVLGMDRVPGLPSYSSPYAAEHVAKVLTLAATAEFHPVKQVVEVTYNNYQSPDHQDR